MRTTFKSADLKCQFSQMSVDASWAIPPVAGFLEMFAGVPYSREEEEKI